MKTSFFILRATDCHGDVWPLVGKVSGIDGVRHESLESAKSVAARFGQDKEFRRSLREANGWEKNSIRGIHVDEVGVV